MSDARQEYINSIKNNMLRDESIRTAPAVIEDIHNLIKLLEAQEGQRGQLSAANGTFSKNNQELTGPKWVAKEFESYADAVIDLLARTQFKLGDMKASGLSDEELAKVSLFIQTALDTRRGTMQQFYHRQTDTLLQFQDEGVAQINESIKGYLPSQERVAAQQAQLQSLGFVNQAKELPESLDKLSKYRTELMRLNQQAAIEREKKKAEVKTEQLAKFDKVTKERTEREANKENAPATQKAAEKEKNQKGRSLFGMFNKAAQKLTSFPGSIEVPKKSAEAVYSD